MKRRVVAGLVRLYPSRWRAEYGEELADVLMRRPLGVWAVVNVVIGALRQHEPWLIVGVPLFVWVAVHELTLLRGWKHPGQATLVGLVPASLLFLGVGFWTILRSGARGVRKAAALAMAPFPAGGILLMAWKYPQGNGVALAPALFLYLVIGFWSVFRCGYGGGRAVMMFSTLVKLPILLGGILGYWQPGGIGAFLGYLGHIPLAGLVGWSGGLGGHAARGVVR